MGIKRFYFLILSFLILYSTFLVGIFAVEVDDYNKCCFAQDAFGVILNSEEDIYCDINLPSNPTDFYSFTFSETDLGAFDNADLLDTINDCDLSNFVEPTNVDQRNICCGTNSVTGHYFLKIYFTSNPGEFNNFKQYYSCSDSNVELSLTEAGESCNDNQVTTTNPQDTQNPNDVSVQGSSQGTAIDHGSVVDINYLTNILNQQKDASIEDYTNSGDLQDIKTCRSDSSGPFGVFMTKNSCEDIKDSQDNSICIYNPYLGGYLGMLNDYVYGNIIDITENSYENPCIDKRSSLKSCYNLKNKINCENENNFPFNDNCVWIESSTYDSDFGEMDGVCISNKVQSYFYSKNLFPDIFSKEKFLNLNFFSYTRNLFLDPSFEIDNSPFWKLGADSEIFLNNLDPDSDTQFKSFHGSKSILMNPSSYISQDIYFPETSTNYLFSFRLAFADDIDLESDNYKDFKLKIFFYDNVEIDLDNIDFRNAVDEDYYYIIDFDDLRENIIGGNKIYGNIFNYFEFPVITSPDIILEGLKFVLYYENSNDDEIISIDAVSLLPTEGETPIDKERIFNPELIFDKRTSNCELCFDKNNFNLCTEEKSNLLGFCEYMTTSKSKPYGDSFPSDYIYEEQNIYLLDNENWKSQSLAQSLIFCELYDTQNSCEDSFIGVCKWSDSDGCFKDQNNDNQLDLVELAFESGDTKQSYGFYPKLFILDEKYDSIINYDIKPEYFNYFCDYISPYSYAYFDWVDSEGNTHTDFQLPSGTEIIGSINLNLEVNDIILESCLPFIDKFEKKIYLDYKIENSNGDISSANKIFSGNSFKETLPLDSFFPINKNDDFLNNGNDYTLTYRFVDQSGNFEQEKIINVVGLDLFSPTILLNEDSYEEKEEGNYFIITNENYESFVFSKDKKFRFKFEDQSKFSCSLTVTNLNEDEAFIYFNNEESLITSDEFNLLGEGINCYKRDDSEGESPIEYCGDATKYNNPNFKYSFTFDMEDFILNDNFMESIGESAIDMELNFKCSDIFHQEFSKSYILKYDFKTSISLITPKVFTLKELNDGFLNEKVDFIALSTDEGLTSCEFNSFGGSTYDFNLISELDSNDNLKIYSSSDDLTGLNFELNDDDVEYQLSDFSIEIGENGGFFIEGQDTEFKKLIIGKLDFEDVGFKKGFISCKDENNNDFSETLSYYYDTEEPKLSGIDKSFSDFELLGSRDDTVLDDTGFFSNKDSETDVYYDSDNLRYYTLIPTGNSFNLNLDGTHSWITEDGFELYWGTFDETSFENEGLIKNLYGEDLMMFESFSISYIDCSLQTQTSNLEEGGYPITFDSCYLNQNSFSDSFSKLDEDGNIENDNNYGGFAAILNVGGFETNELIVPCSDTDCVIGEDGELEPNPDYPNTYLFKKDYTFKVYDKAGNSFLDTFEYTYDSFKEENGLVINLDVDSNEGYYNLETETLGIKDLNLDIKFSLFAPDYRKLVYCDKIDLVYSGNTFNLLNEDDSKVFNIKNSFEGEDLDLPESFQARLSYSCYDVYNIPFSGDINFVYDNIPPVIDSLVFKKGEEVILKNMLSISDNFLYEDNIQLEFQDTGEVSVICNYEVSSLDENEHSCIEESNDKFPSDRISSSFTGSITSQASEFLPLIKLGNTYDGNYFCQKQQKINPNYFPNSGASSPYKLKVKVSCKDLAANEAIFTQNNNQNFQNMILNVYYCDDCGGFNSFDFSFSEGKGFPEIISFMDYNEVVLSTETIGTGVQLDESKILIRLTGSLMDSNSVGGIDRYFYSSQDGFDLKYLDSDNENYKGYIGTIYAYGIDSSGNIGDGSVIEYGDNIDFSSPKGNLEEDFDDDGNPEFSDKIIFFDDSLILNEDYLIEIDNEGNLNYKLYGVDFDLKIDLKDIFEIYSNGIKEESSPSSEFSYLKVSKDNQKIVELKKITEGETCDTPAEDFCIFTLPNPSLEDANYDGILYEDLDSFFNQDALNFNDFSKILEAKNSEEGTISFQVEAKDINGNSISDNFEFEVIDGLEILLLPTDDVNVLNNKYWITEKEENNEVKFKLIGDLGDINTCDIYLGTSNSDTYLTSLDQDLKQGVSFTISPNLLDLTDRKQDIFIECGESIRKSTYLQFILDIANPLVTGEIVDEENLVFENNLYNIYSDEFKLNLQISDFKDESSLIEGELKNVIIKLDNTIIFNLEKVPEIGEQCSSGLEQTNNEGNCFFVNKDYIVYTPNIKVLSGNSYSKVLSLKLDDLDEHTLQVISEDTSGNINDSFSIQIKKSDDIGIILMESSGVNLKNELGNEFYITTISQPLIKFKVIGNLETMVCTLDVSEGSTDISSSIQIDDISGNIFSFDFQSNSLDISNSMNWIYNLNINCNSDSNTKQGNRDTKIVYSDDLLRPIVSIELIDSEFIFEDIIYGNSFSLNLFAQDYKGIVNDVPLDGDLVSVGLKKGGNLVFSLSKKPEDGICLNGDSYGDNLCLFKDSNLDIPSDMTLGNIFDKQVTLNNIEEGTYNLEFFAEDIFGESSASLDVELSNSFGIKLLDTDSVTLVDGGSNGIYFTTEQNSPQFKFKLIGNIPQDLFCELKFRNEQNNLIKNQLLPSVSSQEITVDLLNLGIDLKTLPSWFALVQITCDNNYNEYEKSLNTIIKYIKDEQAPVLDFSVRDEGNYILDESKIFGTSFGLDFEINDFLDFQKEISGDLDSVEILLGSTKIFSFYKSNGESDCQSNELQQGEFCLYLNPTYTEVLPLQNIQSSFSNENSYSGTLRVKNIPLGSNTFTLKGFDSSSNEGSEVLTLFVEDGFGILLIDSTSATVSQLSDGNDFWLANREDPVLRIQLIGDLELFDSSQITGGCTFDLEGNGFPAGQEVVNNYIYNIDLKTLGFSIVNEFDDWESDIEISCKKDDGTSLIKNTKVLFSSDLFAPYVEIELIDSQFIGTPNEIYGDNFDLNFIAEDFLDENKLKTGILNGVLIKLNGEEVYGVYRLPEGEIDCSSANSNLNYVLDTNSNLCKFSLNEINGFGLQFSETNLFSPENFFDLTLSVSNVIVGEYNIEFSAIDSFAHSNSTSKEFSVLDGYGIKLLENQNEGFMLNSYRNAWITSDETPNLSFTLVGSSSDVNSCNIILRNGGVLVEIFEVEKNQDGNFYLDFQNRNINLESFEDKFAGILISCGNLDNLKELETSVKLFNIIPDYVLESENGFLINEGSYKTIITLSSVNQPSRELTCQYNFNGGGFQYFTDDQNNFKTSFSKELDFSNLNNGVISLLVKCNDVLGLEGLQKKYDFKLEQDSNILVNNFRLYGRTSQKYFSADSDNQINLGQDSSYDIQFDINRRDVTCVYSILQTETLFQSIGSFFKKLFGTSMEQVSVSELSYLAEVENVQIGPNSEYELYIDCDVNSGSEGSSFTQSYDLIKNSDGISFEISY